MPRKINPKKFEGVKTMLSIKAALSEKFAKNPNLILEYLAAIRKKYNITGIKKKKLSLR